ncbi:kremen protein 1 [Callorhinchus milii]|uniref:kremen protein 1 n=1 Tax=Callorhinchus milii TaxID=7868 RepID=UPI001C3F647F|nr:kremen protein 1 [Callorhinchus milii]
MEYLTVALLLHTGCGFAVSLGRAEFNTECYTVTGADYRGFQNQTSQQGGKPCLYWNETFQHPYNTNKYPNGEGGLGNHNYCRNPDGDVRPWCYIVEYEDGVYWKYCDIPTCHMPGYLGCFKDNGDPPPLSGISETSNKLTIQTCINFCRSKRFKLAGMESGYACFCGNDADYWKHGEANSTECNQVCFGNHTQLCGGDGRINIFDTLIGSCGGNYSADIGIIYSPDFPDNYANGRVCYWTIQVSGASMIQFHFALFDIRDASDMVEFLDGYSNEVLARFDGRNRPYDSVNVSASFVILYFYSDGANRADGFAVLYKAVKDNQHLLASEGKNSPNTLDTITERVGPGTIGARSSKILYITASPSQSNPNMPVWTIYALAGLLTLTAIVMVSKILLHLTVKSRRIPAQDSSEDCSQSSPSEPWVITYKPSTILFFKKKLKEQQGDRSPLVGD